MRRSPLLAALAAVLLVVTACGGGGGDDADGDAGPDKVSAGVIAIVDVAPIYLGKAKGFFSNRDIDLTLTTAQGGSAIVPAVLSGEFQFGFSNTISLLLAQSRKVPIKAISNGNNSTGVDGKDFAGLFVKADSPIRTAKDLAGRKVAANTLKNIVETSVRASVRKDGGDATKVTFTELAFPDQLPALQAGQVDAIFVVEPFQQAALAAGARKIASSYVDAAPDLTVAMYFTSQDLLARDPDLVKRFTEAMKESLAYADSHPDEVRAALGDYTKIPPETRAALVLPRWPAEVNRASVETLAGLAQTDGLLTAPPDLDALLP
ncbi:ABC transporter substrate-binding protein [Paractinoplanes atraurantiacus]|uniref:NitT/TauT family transport system substrate-binding protein n=1 Tax=Paractinoplanes atraurantiacus TaxID=1036182 RepID=A0A285HS27_9ACTN|nr:ABC transporter substrate-binding protein [Actinoplanes atraurantiacus]SNY38522.1 NitT/TauT family transport system substrate-binding protein [Actinoplanes atraurantiacus]